MKYILFVLRFRPRTVWGGAQGLSSRSMCLLYCLIACRAALGWVASSLLGYQRCHDVLSEETFLILSTCSGFRCRGRPDVTTRECMSLPEAAWLWQSPGPCWADVENEIKAVRASKLAKGKLVWPKSHAETVDGVKTSFSKLESAECFVGRWSGLRKARPFEAVADPDKRLRFGQALQILLTGAWERREPGAIVQYSWLKNKNALRAGCLALQYCQVVFKQPT